MKSFAINLSVCALALAVLPINCFGKKHELPLDPKFLAINQIVILPTVDARAGKKQSANLESLRKHAESDLKSKGYSVSLSDIKGITGEIIEEDLNDAKPDWIKRLGPPEARWVLVIGLRDSNTRVGGTGPLTIGETTNVELMGFLFDKKYGSVVWKATGIGRKGTAGGPAMGGGLAGGLTGMAFTGLDKHEAFVDAMRNLLASIPKLPKGFVPGSGPEYVPEAAPSTQPVVVPIAAPAVQAQVTAPPAAQVQVSLIIDSTPTGADIEVDGAFVGNTPSTIGVAPGKHQIAVKKKGYSDWSKNLNVTGGSIHLSAELEKAPQ